MTLQPTEPGWLIWQAVKDKVVAQMWTYESKVFIKIKPEDRPQRVRVPEDIPTA